MSAHTPPPPPTPVTPRGNASLYNARLVLAALDFYLPAMIASVANNGSILRKTRRVLRQRCTTFFAEVLTIWELKICTLCSAKHS